MKMKIYLLMLVFLINIGLASAQSGLFDASTSGTFAVTGITIIVLVLVVKELIQNFLKRKK